MKDDVASSLGDPLSVNLPGMPVGPARGVRPSAVLSAPRRFTKYFDPLTRLPDRRALCDRLDNIISEGEPAGLLLIDVDHFRDINDTLGHDIGDAMLIEVAKRISAAVPSSALVARLGGDEFAVVVHPLDGNDDLVSATTAVFSEVTSPFEYQGHTLDCQVSIGVSIFPLAATDRVNLFKQADIALYRAKDLGRSRAELFEGSMLVEVEEHARALARARLAISERRVLVHYQPKLILNTGEIAGHEALVRIKDDGIIRGPAWILGSFDNRRIAAQLGSLVCAQVFEDLRIWARKGQTFGHVAINVTDAELRDPSWAPAFLHHLNERTIPPWALQIELTENVLLSRAVWQVKNSLGLLHAKGIKIALDDFGTGYASLAHLRDFPIDTIKIDQSFVETIAEPASRELIRAIVCLGESLRLTVVAEGVETRAQHLALGELGCEQGQGFFYGRPKRSPLQDPTNLDFKLGAERERWSRSRKSCTSARVRSREAALTSLSRSSWGQP